MYGDTVPINSPSTWDIELGAWIIQDGNYPDFAVGQTAEFALEFWVAEGVPYRVSDGRISAKNLEHGLYDAVAEVLVQTDKITILDIGILVYEVPSSKQPSFLKGSNVAARMRLGVDPFHYSQTLSKTGDVLPLVYSWKIRSIFAQTAPFIETLVEAGAITERKIRIRDPQRLGYKEILRTDAWKDDGGCAEYVLRCDLLPIPPKRESCTAIP